MLLFSDESDYSDGAQKNTFIGFFVASSVVNLQKFFVDSWIDNFSVSWYRFSRF